MLTHVARFATYFALLLGLIDCAANGETAGASFGFSFLGFRFSRLLLCSRFAMTLSFNLRRPACYKPLSCER